MPNTGWTAEMQQIKENPETRYVVAPTPEEGRGDPTLTMLCSPGKNCGSKRTLAERTETDEVAEDNAEEDEMAKDSATEDEEAEDYEAEEVNKNEEGGKMADDTPMEEGNEEGDTGGITTIVLDGRAVDQAKGGLQSEEGSATWDRRQEQVATETGGLDSAPTHPGKLNSTQSPQATGAQQGAKEGSLVAGWMHG